jgi:antirestriction protein ArdC
MSKVYGIITDKIIKSLEAGVIPWRKPWAGSSYEPKNLISQKTYTGINFFLLSMASYSSPFFITYKQAKDLGGNVKKGEKGWQIIFAKHVNEKKDNAGNTEKNGYSMMRYYAVFNIDQCENIDEEKIPALQDLEKLKFNPIEQAEKIVKGYIAGPQIESVEQRACYRPRLDTVNMPKKESFESVESYYTTLFHELTHSTGAAKRLDREGITDPIKFGSHKYSKEELIAELGAAFLCSKAGIDNTLKNSTSYIASWLEKLKSKDNAKWIIEAGSKAQKAVNYIDCLER